jgi:uncharacterized protein YecE (DUF72 family)
VPKVITHEKYLDDCEVELGQFCSIMSPLGAKLGPMILQFPYVAKRRDAHEYATGADFINRLKRFVKLLPGDFKWGVEVRNSKWIGPELLDILRDKAISLVFIDYYTMDPLPKLAHREDIFTSHFSYIRFLGDHRKMDAAVKKARSEGKRRADWDSLIQDRSAQMKFWIDPIKHLVSKGIPVYVYFNNHYAGYAPGSVELFSKLYNES